jgi:hypothetical protein
MTGGPTGTRSAGCNKPLEVIERPDKESACWSVAGGNRTPRLSQNRT